MVKELDKLRPEEIINPDLIGGGIPDLGEELANLQAGNSDFDDFDDPVEDEED